MFKGTPDGKKLIELSIKQIEQKLAYEQDKAPRPMIIRRTDTPRPTDVSEELKKMKLTVE
jgi:hypothetical protein